MEILKAENIYKSFGENKVLKGASLTLNKGEIVSLLGVSGGGKTTLFNVLSGISKPDSGRVLLNGDDITGKPGSVSYMLQKDLLLPYRKVIDNVTLPLVVNKVSKKEAREQAEPLFKTFGLDGTQYKYPSQLSGGMRQRLGIAQALLNNPKLLILDEPTAGLDPKERIRFRNLISQISNDKTVILATHIVTDVESIARKVIILGKGRIICNDNPENLTASIKDKVWSFEVERDEIEPALLNYAVSNVQYVNDGFSIKTVGEKPIEHAVNSVATLEEAYLYYVGESGGKK